MQEWVNVLFSSQGLAIVIPLVLFMMTLYLVVKRLVSFLITLLLLCFVIFSGLAIVNYQAVGDYIRGDLDGERYQELKQAVTEFRDDLLDAVDCLKSKMLEDQDEMEGMMEKTEEFQSTLEKRIVQLDHLIAETRQQYEGEEELLESSE